MLASEETVLLSENAELLWIKLQTNQSKPLLIGAFYRPTDNDAQAGAALEESLSKIPKSCYLSNVILSGDFNLPDIHWESMSCKLKPNYTKELNNQYIAIFQDHGLTQVNFENTRGNSILDVVLTTNPDLVTHTSIEDGMSDHKALITDINIKAKPNRKKPRHILNFRKGNIEGVKENLNQHYKDFAMTNPVDRSVEENWNLFKNAITDSIKKHIPSKKINGKHSLPWITTTIRKMIRKKQRLYNKAKSSSDPIHWHKFRALRKYVKRQIQEEHNRYIMNLFEDEPTSGGTDKIYKVGKRFWSYVKSMKRDSSGVLK